MDGDAPGDVPAGKQGACRITHPSLASTYSFTSAQLVALAGNGAAGSTARQQVADRLLKAQAAGHVFNTPDAIMAPGSILEAGSSNAGQFVPPGFSGVVARLAAAGWVLHLSKLSDGQVGVALPGATEAGRATHLPGGVLHDFLGSSDSAAVLAVASLVSKGAVVAFCGMEHGAVVAAATSSPGTGLAGSTQNHTVAVMTNDTDGKAPAGILALIDGVLAQASRSAAAMSGGSFTRPDPPPDGLRLGYAPATMTEAVVNAPAGGSIDRKTSVGILRLATLVAGRVPGTEVGRVVTILWALLVSTGVLFLLPFGLPDGATAEGTPVGGLVTMLASMVRDLGSAAVVGAPRVDHETYVARHRAGWPVAAAAAPSPARPTGAARRYAARPASTGSAAASAPEASLPAAPPPPRS